MLVINAVADLGFFQPIFLVLGLTSGAKFSIGFRPNPDYFSFLRNCFFLFERRESLALSFSILVHFICEVLNMLEACAGPLWGLLSAILNALLLPLMIVAILSSIMGSAGAAVGAILADGIQTISAFAYEILLRLFRLSLSVAAILARLLGRSLILLCGFWTTKK